METLEVFTFACMQSLLPKSKFFQEAQFFCDKEFNHKYKDGVSADSNKKKDIGEVSLHLV